MISQPLFLGAVLALAVAASEWLARRTALRHLGSALLVIVLVAILANVGLIPPYADSIGIYRGAFEHVAPLAIFLLMLQVHLRGLARAGVPMLLLFLLGSLGTMAGVLLGLRVVGGAGAFGQEHAALGGMFVGTYIGGSINFNAVALEYGVVKNGMLYAGAAAVDSAMTTVWMAVTVGLPRLLERFFPARMAPASRRVAADQVGHETYDDREHVDPYDLAVLLALGLGGVWLANVIASWLTGLLQFQVPSVLVLTTLALGLAQLPLVQRLRGTRLLGWLAVMFFLAVIGALCDVSSLVEIGALGRRLAVFVVVVVLTHGLVVFGVCLAVRADVSMASVASQANIGGSTSALALARSLGRDDLMLPAILVGTLGNAIGTYLGFLMVAMLR